MINEKVLFNIEYATLGQMEFELSRAYPETEEEAVAIFQFRKAIRKTIEAIDRYEAENPPTDEVDEINHRITKCGECTEECPSGMHLHVVKEEDEPEEEVE